MRRTSGTRRALERGTASTPEIRAMNLAKPLLALAVLTAATPVAHAAPPKPQVVKLTVTKDGFVPVEVKVRRGAPVRLVVTREVERTCATEIVMKDLGVDRPLPLGKPVSIDLGTPKPGEHRYTCGMDMVAGALRVE
jgi:plastocyanin domain-containing protein